jgi:hypothetical protein
MLKTNASINGMTLIEFMLSMTLSLVMIGVITVIYLTAEKNIALQESLHEIQMNGQIASQLLRKAISTAGYTDSLPLTYKVTGVDGERSDSITTYQADHNQQETNTYFVRQTKRKSSHGNPVSALFKQDSKNHLFELVEGIDGMKIQYDVNLSGQITTQTAGQVENWSKVVGLNIKLMLSSTNGAPLHKEWYIDAALQ